MDKEYEAKYHRQEYENWWFVSRRHLIATFLKKYKIPKEARIIDIGCSGGATLLALREMGYEDLYALDYSPEAIERCKRNGIANAYVMDGHHPDFPEGYFDLIISSDSLEHLQDDALALGNWYKILKQGGYLFVFVPAFMFLWSSHDDINFHYRRYTRKGLKEKVQHASFKVIQSGYWNFLIFLPTFLVRSLEKIWKRKNTSEAGQKDGLVVMPSLLNRMLTKIVKAENYFGRNGLLPVGVSTFAINQK